MLKYITLSLLLLGTTVLCRAQIEKIDTDRPDQTESAVTVPKKWIQLEFGFGKQANNSSENEYQHPTLLSKYGISKRFELRLITTVQTNTDNSNPVLKQSNTGLVPVEIGTKIALWEEKKMLPKTSLLFHLTIPKLASKKFKADKLAPNFRLSMQHTISKLIGIGYNLGAEWDGFSNEATWLYTLSPGFNIANKWYVYIEAFGFISKNNKSQHSLDGGIAYYINRSFKIDLSSGFGISKEAPDWYVAIGASFRFKTGK
jgi:Putative MetA-pathway of phenol degradation